MKRSKEELCSKLGYREFEIRDAEFDEDTREVNISFSSEAEVETWFGIEILSHEVKSVRLERLNTGASLLVNHDRSLQVGVIESARLENGIGRAKVRFGRSAYASEIYQDVKDKIRRCVSVGYRIHDLKSITEKGDTTERFLVTDWEPMEISIVSVAADISVGVNRQFNSIGVQVMPEVNGMENERKRTSEILAIGERFNLETEARNALKSGKTVDEFKGEALEAVSVRSKANNHTISNQINLSEKEKASYSILRAINAATTRNWAGAGFEREVSNEISKKRGELENGFYIPTDLMKRASEVNTVTTSGLIQKEYRPDEFIEYLGDRTVVKQLGARVLSGITGSLDIPRQTGEGEAFWVNEDGEPPQSKIAIDQIQLTPKTLAANYDISRKMLLQSSIAIENYIKMELARVLAIKLDKSILGIGDSKITGLLSDVNLPKLKYSMSNYEAASGTGSSKFNPFNYDNLIDLEYMIPNVSQDMNNLAFLCTNVGRRQLRKATVTASSQDTCWKSNVINDGNRMSFTGTLLDYRAIANNILGTKTINGKKLSPMIFGAWDNIILAEWGVISIISDPYSLSRSGALRLVVHYDVDSAIKHYECFGVAFTDQLTATKVGGFKELFGTDIPTERMISDTASEDLANNVAKKGKN